METTESQDWVGTALEMGQDLEPYGIVEVVMEYANGDTDRFVPRRRDEFASYELHEMSAYLTALNSAIRKGKRR